MVFRLRRAISGGYAAALVVALAVASACTTDYQLGKDNPLFGGPNALEGKQPPGPTIDVNADGGLPLPGAGPKCGTPVDGGVCAASFKTDVLLKAFGEVGKCADAACHGAANPVNQPYINPNDGPAMWSLLTNFALTTGKIYLNPCKTDPAESGILCNLLPAGDPGLCGVHMPSGTGVLPPEVIAKIDTWVRCGSPNN